VVIPLFKYLLGDHQHILVFTSNKRITQLSLLWVKSYYYKIVSTDDTVTDVENKKKKDM
jgi:hypothetical protein